MLNLVESASLRQDYPLDYLRDVEKGIRPTLEEAAPGSPVETLFYAFERFNSIGDWDFYSLRNHIGIVAIATPVSSQSSSTLPEALKSRSDWNGLSLRRIRCMVFADNPCHHAGQTGIARSRQKLVSVFHICFHCLGRCAL